MSQFDCPITQKRLKLCRLPKIQGSNVNHKFPPFGPPILAERRTICAKAYGIKVRCYWELFGEYVRNLGTLCLDGKSTVHCPSGK